MPQKSLHSVCRWLFNPGKGGFLPGNMRPEWGSDSLTTADVVKLVNDKVVPRMPDNVELGMELHYNNEVDENNAAEVRDVMKDTGLKLAMLTPGAHVHSGYGGICSLDPREQQAYDEFGKKVVDLAYGPLREVWRDDVAPTLVLWNGSFGYDMVSIGIKKMYENLKESIAGLCRYEEEKGGQLYMAIEPKPNEGHPAMLLPTVASGLLLWYRLAEDYGISRERKGINKEFGHSEMIGLDHVYDTVEEIDSGGLVHMHLNSQGYNDGIVLGGPGKFDIDMGTRVNGMNVAIAGLIQQAQFGRWKGHDIQARPYDNAEQGVDRLVRSILSWEACARAAEELPEDELMAALKSRETAQAEDIMRHAVVSAQKWFDTLYEK